jgi:hypothetical protein
MVKGVGLSIERRTLFCLNEWDGVTKMRLVRSFRKRDLINSNREQKRMLVEGDQLYTKVVD